MKRIALIGFILFYFSALQAQTERIEVKQGMELEYTIFPMGHVFPCTFKLDTTIDGSMIISWKNERGRGGKYILSRASRDSGTLAFWGPPDYDQEITLDTQQIMLMLSKKQWNELQLKGRVNFDGQFYARKQAIGDNVLSIDGKPGDAIFLQSENGDTRLWVLNNAAMPLLLKMDKNPSGVDLQIERVRK